MASALNRNYPAIQGELEDESELLELEDELEDERDFEDEFEAEDEDEDFLGAMGGLGQALSGILGQGEAEDEVEFDFEVEAETEEEAEDEYEDEAFVNPVRRIYPDAELMAHLSAKAAQASSDGEAEAFLGAMTSIASRLVPRAAGVLSRNAPALIRGTSALGRRLRQNPSTRKYVVAMPVILQRTAQSLADQAGSGRAVTADTAVATLARIADKVLRTPADRNRAVRAVNTFDRRYRRRGQRPLPAARRRTQRTAPPRRVARRRARR